MKKWRHRRWRPKTWPDSAFRIGRILPNIVTLIALCMGLTAIHFAFLRQWEQAVASVLIAGLLDGIDGRLARFLGSSTDFGAELDSLADFINFGVAPALILYFFSLHQLPGIGWGCCLFFSACMALRLARFNIQRGMGNPLYSMGVPAPAAALMAFIPMISSFVFEKAFTPWLSALIMGVTAGLMASRYPTFVLKKMTIPKNRVGLFLLIALVSISALLAAPWQTLLMISAGYVASLPLSGYLFYRALKKS